MVNREAIIDEDNGIYRELDREEYYFLKLLESTADKLDNYLNLGALIKHLRKEKFIEVSKDNSYVRISALGFLYLNSNEVNKLSNSIQPLDNLKTLAKELKNIYPKGKKPGTNYYWADGEALIAKRLKLFYKKYGKDYTDGEIIQATKAYVESFNGSYQYMKLLKYFIFKEEIKDGMAESSSELLTILEKTKEGETEEDIITSLDWTMELA